MQTKNTKRQDIYSVIWGSIFLSPKGFIAKDFVKPAIEAGIDPDNVYHFSDADEMKRFFDSFLIPNDIVYFKTGGEDSDFDDVIDYLRS